LNLRFGILVGSGAPRDWQLAVLENLSALPEVHADCWLQPSTSAAPSAYDMAATEHPWPIGAVPVITAERLDDVRQRGLDFILSFAPLAAAREFAGAARVGVWQFCFGDWSRYAGESAGFWEIYDGASVSSVALAQLQADPDAIRVLREGHLRTHLYSPSRNLLQLEAACIAWPAQVCRELLEGALDLAQCRLQHRYGVAPRAVTRQSRMVLLLKGSWRAVRAQLQLLLAHEQWNIGIIDAPVESLLERPEQAAVRWICAPDRSEFFADPFGVVRQGRLTVLCEHLDYRLGRGVIVSVTPGDVTLVSPVTLIPNPAVHLSYPFTFEHAGHLYCVPETHQAREVALYEVQRYPQEWKRVGTLIAGEPLIDATVCTYQGRWWLFATTPAPKGANAELHVWHADSLSGAWKPHVANPVKTDVRSARPAGTPFMKDGVLYRPAQDCSQTYGGRVVINRVRILNERSFHEEPVVTVEPTAFARYRAGLHTISSVGTQTLVDARRRVFVPAEFRRRIRALWHSGSAAGGQSQASVPPVPSNRLKILWLIETFYPPLVGGAELLAASLTAGLAERGADVQVITRQTIPASADEEQVGRVRVRRLAPAGILKGKGWRALGSMIEFLSRLLITLVRSAPSYDVIIVSGMKVMPLIVVPLCRVLGKRCIVRIESSIELREAISIESLHDMHPIAGRSLLGILQSLRRAALRAADRVVVISHEILAGVADLDLYSMRIVQIPNAVDLGKFRPAVAAEKERLRLTHRLPAGRTLAMYVGRLSRAKGLPMLIEAWPEVHARHPDLYLVIVGSGRHSFDDCEDEIKYLVRKHGLEEHVQFIPETDRVYEYLQAADLFIFPSEYEGLSLGLIEALGSAVVPVVSAVGAAPQLIKEGTNGFLFPPNDPRRMIAALDTALSQRERWDAIGRAARETAMPYDLAAITLRIESLCRETLTERSARGRS
jgi:glycosyltransferase involved in cell wall biosynthesis